MYVIFIGPPLSGKGTEATVLAKETGWLHLCTGELLREAIKLKDPEVLTIQEQMKKGGYTPDSLVLRLACEKLKSQPQKSKNIIFDGTPRTLYQAAYWDGYLARTQESIDAVLNFDASEEVLIARAAERRICRDCGKGYGPVAPPKREGYCDSCPGELVMRNDDQPETVRDRLRIYEAATKPVLNFYRDSGLVKEINANLPTSQVHLEVKKILRL